MNQKICIVVLFVTMCLCLTNAVPTYGLSFGLGQQYPRSYGGYGFGPYAGAVGGIGSTDPIYSNGFGSEYGSRYGSYSGGYGPYNRYGYGNYGSAYGGGIGGGFQY